MPKKHTNKDDFPSPCHTLILYNCFQPFVCFYSPTRKTLRHENIDFRDVETIVYRWVLKIPTS